MINMSDKQIVIADSIDQHREVVRDWIQIMFQHIGWYEIKNQPELSQYVDGLVEQLRTEPTAQDSLPVIIAGVNRGTHSTKSYEVLQGVPEVGDQIPIVFLAEYLQRDAQGGSPLEEEIRAAIPGQNVACFAKPFEYRPAVEKAVEFLEAQAMQPTG